jgi:general stress protein 26
MYKTWFPGGLQDPNLALMKVEVASAEYWDTPGGRVMQLIGAVKMMTSHKPPKSEHAEIDLRGAK